MTTIAELDLSSPTLQKVARFAGVGLLSTVVHLGLFAVLAHSWPSQVANLVALLLATVVNTAINRRWTFGVSGVHRLARHHVQALLVFGLTWVMSAVALALLPQLVSHPSTMVSTAALGFSMAVSTLIRFVAMQRWIFAPAPAA